MTGSLVLEELAEATRAIGAVAGLRLGIEIEIVEVDKVGLHFLDSIANNPFQPRQVFGV